MPPSWIPVARPSSFKQLLHSIRYGTLRPYGGCRVSVLFCLPIAPMPCAEASLVKAEYHLLTKPSTLLYTNRPFIGRSGSGLSLNIDRCQSLFRWVAAPETLR